MADPSPTPKSDPRPAGATPRWAKVFWIIALVVVLLFVILLIAGGGGHGPGRHTGDGGGQARPRVVAHGGQQP